MTVNTIVVDILAILLLGLAICLWIDRKRWIEIARDAAESYRAIKEAYKELDSFAKALDAENAELTVKCNQYEALIGERLDDAVPDEKVNEVDCYMTACDECQIGDCPCNIDKNDGVGGFSNMLDDDIEAARTTFKKPCCSCDNGVYNTSECIGCGPENSYENYTPIKY